MKIWSGNPNGDLARVLRRPLLSMCTRYTIMHNDNEALLCVTRYFFHSLTHTIHVYEKKYQYALNPVAHFHGASIWRLNCLANVSKTGLNQSYGIMVNYRYDLMNIKINNTQYMLKGTTSYSDYNY